MNEDTVTNGIKKTVTNGILLGLFLAMGMLFFMGFEPQHRPLAISGLFYSPIPILVAVMIYITVMGTRKVMGSE